MPDTIEKTIYKLEIDDSGYIKGVDNLSASTKKFSDQQEAANKRLKENEAALKASADVVEKNRKALEAYAGADKKYKEQLESNFKASQQSHVKLTELVANVRKGYEAANKAAQDFEKTSLRATQLQQETTGGKIPVSPPPGIIPSSPLISPQLFNDFNLPDLIENVSEEFEQLRVAIQVADERLSELNQTSEEFKLLAPIIKEAKKALQDFESVQKQAIGSQASLRSQISQGKDELTKLEAAGKGASKQYQDLEIKVANLTDAYGDQQARIRVLASDTRLLDFGKASVQSAISSFQAYSAIMILVGGENEKLQKRTLELFAAMQLLTALEQLSTTVKRGGVIATNLQSASQAVYTTIVGASTGALRAFRIALLASTGIGIIIGIGLLVKKYQELKAAADEATKQQKLFKEINEEAAKSIGGEVAQIEVFRNKLNDLSLSQKERVTVAKEYNKTAEEANKIDLKQIDNLDLLNEKIDRQTKLIIARSVALAATAKLGEAATKFVDLQLQVSQQLQGKPEDFVKNAVTGALQQREAIGQASEANNQYRDDLDKLDKQISKTFGSVKKAIGLKELIEEKNKAKKELDDLGNLLSPLITPERLTTAGGTGKATKEIENVYVKTLRDLLTRLRAAGKAEIQDEDLILKEFVDKLFVEIDKIDELVSKKQLTKQQGGILVTILEQIIGKEFDKSIAEFRKKVQTAINKLNDELESIQSKANQDTLNLLQNDFDRRAALIEFNEQREIADAREATEERLSALELDRLLIGEQAYQRARAVIVETGALAILNIEQKAALARQDLAADIFKQSLDAFQAGLNQGLIARDEELAKLIRSASDKFLTGKITFEQFQKELTAIQRNEESIRRDRTLDNQRSELAALERQIESTIDKTTKQYADLLKLRDDYRKKLAEGEAEDAVKDAQDLNEDPNKKKRDSLFAYVESVGQLADATIAFWQKANEAESAALDRSITLQERRVEAAQRIAERGNASYLKQEEDRLKEVLIARENAARRELAINAALQASQLLVGITGAISKIATPGIGIAETIGAIATIFAALATGYGLVKSLQGNQPKFAKGTKYVKREGHPSGTDTIPAWLNEGEAVIPAEKNKAYHPTVKAVYEGTIPAEHINRFVNTYHKVKPIPQPNYQRIKDAAELHISSDGKMAVLLTEHSSLLKENNELQRQILKKNIRVEQHIDRNGVAAMVTEYIDQTQKDKRL